MTTWGSETQISTTLDDHIYVKTNFMSDDVVYAFWFNDDLNDLHGSIIANISQDYSMNIEFDMSNVASGDSYKLQLNYSVDGSETEFIPYVYNTSGSWDDMSSQGTLSSTSFTEKEYNLTSWHRSGGGVTQLRFMGGNETNDDVNSTLDLEYVRVKTFADYIGITGGIAGDLFGWSVSNASDVNDDGSYDDVIVGAPGWGSDKGRAYIYNGASTLDSTADVTLSGQSTGDKFGYSVHYAGDFGGDGVPDVIVGAPYFDDGATGDCGIIYVYNGSSSMDNIYDYYHIGEQANEHFGWSVGFSLNFNGSTNMSVVAGAPHKDGSTDTGEAEVLWDSNAVVIPEYSTIMVPVVGMIIFFSISKRNRKKKQTNHKHHNEPPSQKTKGGDIKE
jgi:hypothetical protein